MELSVIIVSYNVKYFLEQCLYSVEKAIRSSGFQPGVSAEIIVVDNASVDGSVDWLQPKFLTVNFVRNLKNEGFAKANNHGLKLARGRFILFLNPDTLLPESILRHAISFFDSHPGAGALGVRMIDGSGRFLPESKRGFPTPWRSFCRLSGLSALLPYSKSFTGYYLGHLAEKAIHEVDALAGAFMMVRKAVLEDTGGFDEQFFMYAEDIDLSKRIQEKGFKNFYLGNSSILHFKGESTPRDLRYVKLFYRAMEQFVQKHYKGTTSRLTIFLLRTGIRIRGLLAAIGLKKGPTLQKIIESISLQGDPVSIRKLKLALSDSMIGFNEMANANTIVYCVGDDFSFADLIDSMNKFSSGKKVLIHTAGSASVIGKTERNGRGQVIPL